MHSIRHCVSIVTGLNDEDVTDVLKAFDQYRDNGVPIGRASLMAVDDTIATLLEERQAILAAAREQFPEAFAEPAAPVAAADAASLSADDFDALINEVQAERKKPTKSKKQQAEDRAQESRMRAIREHFTPGNIIKSNYWQDHDRVIAFDEGDNLRGWSVTVEKVEKRGDEWVATDRPRVHATAPDPRDVVVERAQPTPADALKDAARSAAAGVKEGFAGLDALFGRKGTLGSGPAFDEETWQKAKPHFEAAFREFVAAGKSLKEFVRFILDTYNDAIIPYLKRWHTDHATAATQPEPATEPTPEAAPQLEPPTKIEDAGEKMAGKRADQFTKDLRDNATGNRGKDLEKLLDRVSKSAIWPVKQAESATSGTTVYLSRVRDQLKSFVEMAGERAGGGRGKYSDSFSEALMRWVGSASDDELRDMEKFAGEYVATIESVRDATSDAMTIEQARAALEKLIVDKEIPIADARQQGIVSQADVTGSSRRGGEWVTTATYYTATGKALRGFVRKGRVAELYDRDGLIRTIKDGDSATKTKPMVRPRLDEIRRTLKTDHRDGKNVTAQSFIDTFGFRGVEFGNWVNQAERQVNLNLAYDAFYDLADTLGIPPKAISLGGKLGMAFGSRGSGQHAAHYEPDTVVINLTKTKGDGTVAHEWGHALAYAIRQSGPRRLEVVRHPDGNGFALRWVNSQTYLTGGDGGKVVKWDSEDDAKKYGMPAHDPGPVGDGAKAVAGLQNALAKRFSVEQAVAAVNRLLSGQAYVSNQKSKGPIGMAKDFIARRYWQHPSWGVIVPTQFKVEADKLGKGYWGNDEELWARAFEAYVFDAMEGESPYLVTDWVADGTVSKDAGYKGRPYPSGDERGIFAGFFRDLLANVVWTENGPTIKEGYQPLAERQRNAVIEALDALAGRLDSRQEELKQGEAHEDGLWWYRYPRDVTRAPGKLPKGWFAYDDGAYAVGYPAALDVSDIDEFKLTALAPDRWKPGDKTVYLKKDDGGETERSDQPDAVRDDGEDALDQASTEDGGAPDQAGATDAGVTERPGEGERADRPTGERSGDRSGVGTGAGPGPLDSASVGGGTTATGSGQDAVQPAGTNYRIRPEDHVGEGSIEKKFADNVAAIRVLKQVEAENRLATPEEQRILVRYVGWGGMPQAFSYHRQEGWEEKKAELKDLLTTEEYEAARASTTNAHYTAPRVISEIWRGLERLGFKGGRVLEPAVGVGHFFGLMPPEIAQASKLVGIELDSLTARIAKQLYQQAAIYNKGYQDTTLPAGFFDVVVSNVPFSDIDKPVDKRYNAERLNLHDYYFRKSLALVRPGGIVAFITSKGTMDKQETRARELFARDAEFIAAIRLPEDAFQENANTTVTTDIIFMRRRVPGAQPLPERAWIKTREATLEDQQGYQRDGIYSNEYFLDSPNQVLGVPYARRGRYGPTVEYAVRSAGTNLGDRLAAAMAQLPENVVVTTDRVEELEKAAQSIPAEGETKDGGFAIKDDKLWRREGDLFVPVAENTAKEKSRGQIIRHSLVVRDKIRALLRARTSDASESEIKQHKLAIDKAYKAFVKRFGFLNQKENVEAFAEDPDSALLLAIEKWDAEKGKGERIDVDFTKRRPIDRADNAADALIATLAARGRVDWDHITRLTGLSRMQAREELRGKVYDDPEQGWVTSDEYLSGNVRAKLATAKAAAAADAAYNENVEALEAAQPADLPPSKITVRPGAAWVPGDDVALFMAEMLSASVSRLNVTYVPNIGKWVIGFQARTEAEQKRIRDRLMRSTEATVTWGTPSVNFIELMEYALNGGFPKVYYPPDADGKRALNKKATEQANAKLQMVKERFSRWVWEDAERATRLARLYNDEWNNIRRRTFTYPAMPDQIDEKGNIRLPGMALGLALRPHQANGVWRGLQGNVYYAHEVGTGKTFTLSALAMEGRRLGIYKKPMLVVLNSTIDQIRAEFLRLYPGANILSLNISEKKAQRKLQLARIALNDWDAVIVTHESYSRIPMSAEAIRANFSREISELENAILTAKGDKMNARVVKELEKAKRALENRMKRELEKREKDDLLTFEEVGVDAVLVDEAQAFKNLMFATRLGRQVRGLNPDGSGIAFDMYMKTNYLNDTYGRGVVMASGTPISNSVGELFTLSRYLQPSELRHRGVQQFDPWANTFGDIGQVAEYLPEGGGYQMVTKFNRFTNIPELMQMVFSVMDTVKAADTGIVRPKVKGGAPTPVLVPQNEAVSEYMKALSDRAQTIRKNPKQALPDNMLNVVTDGRKAAMDMRMVDPTEKDYDNTKTNAAVSNIVRLWKESEDKRGTQLVFSDLGSPETDGFSVYKDLKAKLVKAGIPADQIAFVHDAKDGRQRAALFAKVRSGQVRVFIGSTKKAGTGVNVQDRVVAIHHLDVHWNLANYEQRNGRGIRQGNINPEVQIFNYATEGTVDAFMWDKVAAKGKFIDQVMSGDVNVREAEDVSQETMSASEMVAVASGDPLIAEKVGLESQVMKLALQEAAFYDTMMKIRQDLASYPGQIKAKRAASARDRDVARQLGQIDTVTIGEQVYSLKDENQLKALSAAIKKEADANIKRVEAESDAKKQNVDMARIIGEVSGGGVRLPFLVRAPWFFRGSDTVTVQVNSLSGARTYDGGVSPERIFTGMARDLEREAQERLDEADVLEQQIPKLQAESAKTFDGADRLAQLRKRLDEVQAQLLGKQQEPVVGDVGEDEADSAAGFRFVKNADGVMVVSSAVDVAFPDLPDNQFFAYFNGEKFSITEASTGLSVSNGSTQEEAARKFQEIIDQRGAEAIAKIIEGKPKITAEEREAALAEAQRSSPKYSRGADLLQQDRPLEELVMSVARVQEALGDAPARFSVPVKVYTTAAEASSDLGFTMPDDVWGVHYKGQISMIAQNLQSDAAVEFTYWHELFHAGADAIEKADGFKAFEDSLQRVAMSNPTVKRAAFVWREKYGKQEADMLRRFGIPEESIPRRVLLKSWEEAVADISGENPNLRNIDRLIAALQTLLRKLGFERLANWMEGKTNAEVLALIRRAREALTPEGALVLRGRDAPAMARGDDAPGPIFYSALARAVAGVKQASGTAEQWKGIIRNLQGVKADEIEWSGVMEWLDMQSGRVTREALVEYLYLNGVKVEETMHGGDGERNRLASERGNLVVQLDALGYMTQFNAQDGTFIGLERRLDGAAFGLDEDGQLLAEADDDVPSDVRSLAADLAEISLEEYDIRQEGGTRYEKYTLPGGENYRELLLTLPDKKQRWWAKNGQGVERIFYDAEEASRFAGPAGDSRAMDEQTVDRMRSQFRSSHWDEANIVAHVRFNERVDDQGRRVLFLEELQSDWAQQGKRKGFAQPDKELPAGYELTDETARARDSFGVERVPLTEPARWSYQGPGVSSRIYNTREEAIAAAFVDARSRQHNVPRGPFVQKTEAWVGLALKRMIRWAAENGFDRIAWTTGEQQAERYDLSKQVHRISWEEKTGFFRAHAFTGSDVVKTGVSAKDLPDLVGKDVADKLLQAKPTPQFRGDTDGPRIVSGLDLKVGGEGMRAFYDKIVPGVARDVLKKLGGDRLQTIRISPFRELLIQQEDGYFYVKERGNSGNYGQFAERANAEQKIAEMQRRLVQSQPGFDITPQMRETAMQGMPMFSRGPLLQKSLDAVGDLFHSDRTFNRWWHKTVGTQYHKAQIDKHFKRVFDTGQAYLNDLSLFSMRAEAEAPGILLSLESVWDAFTRRRMSEADNAKVGEAIFQGTLDDTVYTADELRTVFGFNDQQVDLYQQARRAINQSLDELTKSQMGKMAKAVGVMHESVMRAKDETLPLADFYDRMRDHIEYRIAALELLNVNEQDADKRQRREDVMAEMRAQIKSLTVLFNRVSKLKQEGYAPLIRFGQYTVSVRDQAGEQVYFGMYESQFEANRAARAFRDDMPDASVQTGMLSNEQYQMFQGLTPETVELFAQNAGFDKDAAFQEFLRLAVNNRSALKRLIRRKETPGFSTDVPRVLAQFVTSNARLAAQNYHAGEMMQAIDDIPKRKGDVISEAIKLREYMMDPQEESAALRGWLFFNFIGGSIASAIVNATQPITMTAPYLTMFASDAVVAKELTKASMEAAKNAPGADIADAYKRALERGIIAPHEIHQLMAEARGAYSPGGMATLLGKQYGRAVSATHRLTKIWGAFFSMAEAFNRRTTFIASYRIAVRNNHPDPFAFAEQAVADTQGLYNKGNRPNWARGPILSVVFTFKQFSIAYVEWLKRLPGAQRTRALAILFLAAGINGLPFAEDIQDIIDAVGQWLGYGTNTKKWLRQHAAEILGDMGGQFVNHGISAIMPIDISARMGVGNLLPGTGALKQSSTDKTRDILEFLGPIGSVGNNLVQGKPAEALVPKAIRDVYTMIKMLDTGEYRDSTGKLLARDVTTAEAIWKGTGFNPDRIARQGRKVWTNTQDVRLVRAVEADITFKWAQGIVEKDVAKVREAQQDLKDWNEKNPDMQIRIEKQQIQKRVADLQKTREERLIRQSPKEIRGSVARDVQP